MNIKKAQTTIEFLIVLGSAIMFAAVFLLIITENMAERNRLNEEIAVKQLALNIQNEINLASGASNGYSREFYIEELINNKNYTIEIIDDRIYVSTEKNAISLHIEKIQGSIKKGRNTIRKEDNNIYLNM